MKRIPANRRSGILSLRVALVLLAATLLPLLAFAAAPSWWSTRGAPDANASADDYAPANQGQLKNMAKAAIVEMDAKLPGGAGDTLHNLVGSWSAPAAQTNDFAPINIGQLKSVAKPFYDRLIAAGIATDYPWAAAPSPADDFAVANIGQIKNLFSFELPAPQPLSTSDPLATGQNSASLAVEPDGSLWIWGDHFGAGSDFDRAYPRPFAGVADARSVAAGNRHLALLGSDGAVWTWGDNDAGQLGDGTTTNRTIPAAVPNLANVTSLKAGDAHTLALLQGGTVVAWGDNYYGELGNSNGVASATPVQVVGLDGVQKIAAGIGRNVALKNDGTVWTWGYDHTTRKPVKKSPAPHLRRRPPSGIA